jgi:PAS domain S-box-containing protein
VYFRFDQESRLVMMSPSAVHTFGCNSLAEIQGFPATSLWKNPEDRAIMIDAMKQQGGSVQDWEAVFVKRDGTPFWVSVTARLHTNDAGEFQGTEGMIRDISGRKKTEEALKNALNKLNMLSSITRHDILNQIMGLRTFLELSKEDLKGTKYEAFIDKEAQAAEAIQRQIEFTRYYQDIGVNASTWQDAGSVIQEAVNQLNTRSINVQVQVTGIEIFADPLIVKVFFNLMENSLRHGGQVTEMAFSSRETDAGLVITYRDNGVGITQEDKTKLFRKGFGKHTGLGLFLSREILAITGITITENGEPGRGVQFELTVPKEGYR